jgi:hypothetical protein
VVTLLADAWFTGLHWTWADSPAAERRAAGVVWTFTRVVVPLALLVVYRHSTRPVTPLRRRARCRRWGGGRRHQSGG